MERDQFGRAYAILILSTVLVLIYPWVHANVPWLKEHFRSYAGVNDLFSNPTEDSLTTAFQDSLLPSAPADTIPAPKPEPIPFPSKTQEGMNSFFEALRAGNSQVRIAWFGDSAIEGDLICQTVRDSLQRKFGGTGNGFAPVIARVRGFRHTIQDENTGKWYARYLGQKNPRSIPFGLAGSYFLADTLPSVFDSLYIHARDTAAYALLPWETLPGASFKATRSAQTVRLFYGKPDSLTGYRADDPICKVEIGEHARYLRLHPTAELTETRLSDARIREIGFSVASRFEFPVFGISMESPTGVILDNLPSRGNHGDRLMQTPVEMYQAFDSLMDYDLVILQFGLNALAAEMEDFSWYEAEMTRLVRFMRQAFPGKPILIVAPTDRAIKYEDILMTDPSLPRVTAVLKRVSEREKTSFFSFYEAMGGSGTMIDWVDNKTPRLANLDYTHLNLQGAEIAGRLFLQYLLKEYDAYLAGKNEPVE